MELHLKIIGIISILLAVIHIAFPKYFDWENELQSISLINKQMVYVHTFFIAVTVFLFGVLCIYCSKEIISTDLGKKISFGLCIFWGLRLIFQLFVYSSKLWKGKSFETVIHIIFLLLWAYFTIIFFLIFWG